MRTKLLLIAALAVVLAVGLPWQTASAATISSLTSTANNFFTVSGSDLINTGQPTLGSLTLTSGTANFGSNANQLNNVVTYDGSTNQDTTYTLTPSSGAIVTVLLNTSVYTSGYDIYSIVSLTGTGQGRAAQKFDVAYSTVTNPLTFITLSGDAGSTVDRSASADIAEMQVTISGGGGAIASRAALRFTFYDGLLPPGTYLNDMYREIDVFGTAVPEPGTVVLLATGLLGLMCHTWRKRK